MNFVQKNGELNEIFGRQSFANVFILDLDFEVFIRIYINFIFYKFLQGTTRPTHYHVLLDEIGFSPDDLQELVHSLSYV